MEWKISQDGTEYWLKVGQEDYELLWKIIPGFFKDFIWALNDKVRERRAEKQIDLLLKRKNKVKMSWKEIAAVEPKLFFSIIWNWSLEDDESIQEKWINLLYNASTNWNVIVWYSEILKELWSNEVKVLDKIYNDWVMVSQRDNKNIESIVFETEKISQLFGIPLNNVRLMINNFYRLKLIEPPEFTWMSTGWEDNLHPILRTDMYFQLTYLWISFIEACKAD